MIRGKSPSNEGLLRNLNPIMDTTYLNCSPVSVGSSKGIQLCRVSRALSEMRLPSDDF